MQEQLNLPLCNLAPHTLNAKLYGVEKKDDNGNQEFADLLQSIKTHGVMTPLVVTAKRYVTGGTERFHVIISGHRRFYAAKAARLEAVPVTLEPTEDPLEIQELLIAANKQRQKTTEQIAREFECLEIIEKEKALNRMRKGKTDPVVNSPQGQTGKARDIAAAKVGLSGQTAERSAKVVVKIDQLKKEGKTAEAEELRETLNKKSVNAAYQQINPPAPVKEKAKKGTISLPPTFTPPTLTGDQVTGTDQAKIKDLEERIKLLGEVNSELLQANTELKAGVEVAYKDKLENHNQAEQRIMREIDHLRIAANHWWDWRERIAKLVAAKHQVVVENFPPAIWEENQPLQQAIYEFVKEKEKTKETDISKHFTGKGEKPEAVELAIYDLWEESAIQGEWDGSIILSTSESCRMKFEEEIERRQKQQQGKSQQQQKPQQQQQQKPQQQKNQPQQQKGGNKANDNNPKSQQAGKAKVSKKHRKHH